MTLLKIATCCAALLALAGCSETQTTKKEPEKPLEPATGRHALYQMYTAARAWAADIQVLRVSSLQLPPVKAEPGRSGAWQVTFVSPSRGKAKTYTWSAIEAEGNLHKGVFAGLDESWSGQRGNQKPFLLAAVKTDSDEVYKTAMKKGAEYSKKNPDKPINFLLEYTAQFGNPAWRVIWGTSAGTSNFSIFVDASTGEYLQTMR